MFSSNVVIHKNGASGHTIGEFTQERESKMYKSSKKEHLLPWLQSELASSDDLCLQELQSQGKKAIFFYIQSICDPKLVQDNLLVPFWEIESMNGYLSYLDSLSQTKPFEDQETTLRKILFGYALFISGSHIRLIEIKKVANNGILEAKIESTIQGPQNALSEDLVTNLNIIRHRYCQPRLKIENKELGNISPIPIAVVYDEQFVEAEVLNELRQKLADIQTQSGIIQAIGQLQRLLTQNKRTLFPTMVITERPDRIAYNLAQGKIIILMAGNPFALILPAIFYDFMSSMDDLYQSYWVSRFHIALRYLGLFISITLPALYVVTTAYNPELFRVQLALTIAGSRFAVPYPAFIEVLFMLVMMEFLTEASLRLPKVIGSTATTVGGLILGQAATEAALVSNIMVILVAAVAISNFVIPINAMGFSMRVVKYVLLAVSTLFGMIGFVVGFVGVLAYLVHLDSFGQPYLKLFLRSSADGEELRGRKKEESG